MSMFDPSDFQAALEMLCNQAADRIRDNAARIVAALPADPDSLRRMHDEHRAHAVWADGMSLTLTQAAGLYHACRIFAPGSKLAVASESAIENLTRDIVDVAAKPVPPCALNGRLGVSLLELLPVAMGMVAEITHTTNGYQGELRLEGPLADTLAAGFAATLAGDGLAGDGAASEVIKAVLPALRCVVATARDAATTVANAANAALNAADPVTPSIPDPSPNGPGLDPALRVIAVIERGTSKAGRGDALTLDDRAVALLTRWIKEEKSGISMNRIAKALECHHSSLRDCTTFQSLWALHRDKVPSGYRDARTGDIERADGD